MKRVFAALMVLLFPVMAGLQAATRYVGGDISLLPEYENAGAKYKTHEGAPIADLLPWLHQEGMNAMRVRLFVDPKAYTGADRDPNACQDLDYIIPLCRRIVESGFALMLDFHYSDTWADPAKQWTPAAWRGLSDEQLYAKIAEYTRDVLTTLKANGIVPQMIQTGNEISYGMLWGSETQSDSSLKKCYNGSEANWPRFIKLLENAISACREVCPDAKIILHTERVGDISTLRNFYKHMQQVDYDIIGLSYYPYWHGKLTKLNDALRMLESEFSSKEVMIVETGYSYKWAVPGSEIDYTGTYPYSDTGQAAFTRDLVEVLLRHAQVTGLFWWWMEYNAYGTSLSGWYNAPLFDSTTGRATAALKQLCSFASADNAVSELDAEASSSAIGIYDLAGRRLQKRPESGLYIENSKIRL